jgi:hypothetical protein
MLGVRAVHVSEPGAIVRDHGGARASGVNTGFTVDIVLDMARAHAAVWSRMQSLQLTKWSYLKDFSSTFFWLSRLCGEHGLNAEADAMLAGACEMRAGHGAATLRFYGFAAEVLGRRRVARLSEWARAGLGRKALAHD